jgi:carboxymethylenebutenolidase
MDDAHISSLTAATSLPVQRRQFLAMTTCVVGYTALTGPINAQVISTPADGLTAGEVKVTSAGLDIPAYRAMPAKGGPFPTVLVIQEVFGVHEHIKDICRRFAKLGYYAIAPELYARQGDPSKYKLDEIPKLIGEIVSKVPDAQVAADLDACVNFAKASGSADAAQLGVIGFCWGGRQVWLYTAHNPNVKAGAAFYGPLAGKPDDLRPKFPVDIAANLKGNVLGIYGGADTGIPLDTVEQMRAALKSAGSKSRIDVYDGAPHGFHADYRPSYRKDAAEDAFRKTIAWFKENGAG